MLRRKKPKRFSLSELKVLYKLMLVQNFFCVYSLKINTLREFDYVMIALVPTNVSAISCAIEIKEFKAYNYFDDITFSIIEGECRMRPLGRPDNNHKAWILAATLFTASLLVCTSPVYADEGWKDNSIASQNDAAQSTGNDTKDVLWEDDTKLVTTPPEEEESSTVSTTENAEKASDQEESNKTEEKETSENKDEAVLTQTSLPLEVVKQGKNLVLRDTNTGEIRKDNAFVALRGKYYFPNAQGKLYCNRFITFGPKVAYYMGDDGSVMHGLVKVGDKLYLLDSETGILNKANRWVEYEGKYYFPNAHGEVYHNRFITFGPKVAYYMGSEGTRMHGVQQVGDALYLLDEETGLLRKDNRWVSNGGKEYFPNAQGQLYHNRLIHFGPKYSYFMGSDGSKQHGYTYGDGTLYRLDDSTGMLIKHPGWYEYEGKTYYARANGMPYRNQLLSFGTYGYVMGADGSRQGKGWHKISSYTYYSPKNDGKTTRGWQGINGKYYYFSPYNFAMYRGIKTTGDRVHYFDPDYGYLRSGKILTTGTKYNFVYDFPSVTAAELSNAGLNRDARFFKGQEIANEALKANGTAYVGFADDLKKGTYCSGLAYRAHKNLGIAIYGASNNPRTNDIYDQVNLQYKTIQDFGGQAIPFNFSRMAAGDVLFFRDHRAPQSMVNHAAVYVGLYKNVPSVIHATLAHGTVMDSIDEVIYKTWHYEPKPNFARFY